MGMEDYTMTQQGIIKRYYQNIDGIQLQKLSDLVGELYLSEGKKKEKVWKSIIGLLTKMEIPQSRIDHIVNSGKPELIAQLVKELHGKS
jgi:hypothetical protein